MRRLSKKNFPVGYFLPAAIVLSSLFLPQLVFAAKPKNFTDIVRILTNLLNATVPALFSLALLLFFWGIAKFMLNASDEKARTEGRDTIFYGIIALFVIFSLWGILRLLENTFLTT